MEAKTALLLGLLTIFGIAVTAEKSDGSNENQKPPFCGSNDCPRYQVVKKYDNFEVRQYEGTRWVSTALEEDLLGIGMVKSFRRLFKYINGSNAEGRTIEMTVPVAIDVPLKQPSTYNSTMSFFLPHDVENPPKPTDPEVRFDTLAPFTVYVKTFGGYALGFMYEKKAKDLAEELRTLGLEFDDTYFVRAGYNDPFTLFNRHNEVWYTAK